jgi:hypothetical protein
MVRAKNRVSLLIGVSVATLVTLHALSAPSRPTIFGSPYFITAVRVQLAISVGVFACSTHPSSAIIKIGNTRASICIKTEIYPLFREGPIVTSVHSQPQLLPAKLTNLPAASAPPAYPGEFRARIAGLGSWPDPYNDLDLLRFTHSTLDSPRNGLTCADDLTCFS